MYLPDASTAWGVILYPKCTSRVDAKSEHSFKLSQVQAKAKLWSSDMYTLSSTKEKF